MAASVSVGLRSLGHGLIFRIPSPSLLSLVMHIWQHIPTYLHTSHAKHTGVTSSFRLLECREKQKKPSTCFVLDEVAGIAHSLLDSL